jgi:regulation of enolase protein 1 (concanavalin A-like superfamily)
MREHGDPNCLYFEAYLAGELRVIGRGLAPPGSIWLRIERLGEEVRALCSADGASWNSCGCMRLPVREPTSAGLTAWTESGGTPVWFEGFLLWKAATGS